MQFLKDSSAQVLSRLVRADTYRESITYPCARSYTAVTTKHTVVDAAASLRAEEQHEQ